jgi:hypothetical protein
MSTADINEIVQATRRKPARDTDWEQLAKRLETARSNFLVGRGNLNHRRVPSEIEADLHYIGNWIHNEKSRAEWLADIAKDVYLELEQAAASLEDVDGSTRTERLDRLLEEAQRGNTRSISDLKTIALAAAEVVALRKSQSPSRHTVDTTLWELFNTLDVIYQELFGREPSITYDDYCQSRGGPFTRFVHKFVDVACRHTEPSTQSFASSDALKIRRLSEKEIGGRVHVWLKKQKTL